MFDPTPFPCGLHFLHAGLQPEQAERARLFGATVLSSHNTAARSLDELLTQLGTDFALPASFQPTLESLFFHLCQCDWPQAPNTEDGLCISLTGLPVFAAEQPAGWLELIETLYVITLAWGQSGMACSILVDAPLPQAARG